MPRLYRCPYCGLTFTSIDELREHVKRKHGAPRVCPCCGAPIYARISDVVAHATNVVASTAASGAPDPCHTALLLVYGGVDALRRIGVPLHYATIMLALVSGASTEKKVMRVIVPEWMNLSWDKVRSVIDEWYRRPPSRRLIEKLDPGAGGRIVTFKVSVADAAKVSIIAMRVGVPQASVIRAAYCAAVGCPKNENHRSAEHA